MEIVFNKVYELIYSNVKEIFNMEIDKSYLQYATKSEFGEFQTNFAMIKARELKKSPVVIANEFIEKFDKKDIVKDIKVAGPGFINIYLTDKFINENVKKIGVEKYDYAIDSNKKVIIDYSSPNIAKRMHVGHLRSTIIGDSIKRIYKELGFDIYGDNHIGDWGTQFGKLIVAYNNWLDIKKYEENPVEELERLYVLFSIKAKENPELEDIAREELRKVQSGDKRNIELWKEFITYSMKEYEKVYNRLDISFEMVYGESFYNEMMKDVVKLLREKNISKVDEGADVVFFENLPPCIVRKKDGSYLYSTSDLATIIFRKDKLNVDEAIYVVDERQQGHFNQVFEIANMIGSPYNYKKSHASFGIMRFADGLIFSSRQGNVIKLIDLLDEAKKEAQKLVEEKNSNLSKEEIENISEIIGVGAIKYFDLSQNRLSAITFDWDKVLSFDGNTGPYLQYTYVRIQSIFKKVKELGIEYDKNSDILNSESTEIEKELAFLLLKSPSALIKAYEQQRPNIIADYIYDLAKKYNTFYNQIKILDSNNEMISARLNLIEKVAYVIRRNLYLLGIKIVDKM